MPRQSQLKFPIKKRTPTPRNIKLSSSTENADPGPKPCGGAKRALFGGADSPAASPEKARISDENVTRGLKCSTPSKKNNVSPLSEAKHAFHTGLPNRLIGRSKEIADIHCFLNEHIDGQTSGSLYISGAPGTGKTSSLMYVKNSIKKQFRFAFVNCMSVNTPAAIYRSIAEELCLPGKVVSSKTVVSNLKKFMTENVTVLVLDEIDQLDCKGQEVLYSLFEWPHLPKSKLILVGIANALDLTDRILPRLHTFQCQPKLMHFQPYTKDQIVCILEDRLSEVQSDGRTVMNPMAVQLCARKIAASTGDIRKALDVCRRAVEVVENRSSPKPVLGSTSDDRCNPGSPSKRRPTSVDLQDITSVLHEVYGSRLQASSNSGGAVSMPLQHTLLLCTLVLMRKHVRPNDMTLGKLYDTYKRVCAKRDIAVVSECAFHGMCKLVESRGFLLLRPSKVSARMTKVILKVEEDETEHVLQDKVMLPSILADRSVLAK